MKTLGKSLAIVVVPLLAVAASVGTAPAASAANPTLAFNWNIDATTTIKKLNQKVTVPRGSFVGSVDLVTGALTGSITLPPASSTVKLAGLGLAKATFKIAQVKPVSGKVDIATLKATATSVFKIRVTKVSPVLAPSVNLVGDACTTSKSISVTMSGLASLTGASKFSGTFSIPTFKDCGLATIALNQLIPGPGNTFAATATPKPAA